jgi:uncharacterized RDD family membrane protein YckC
MIAPADDGLPGPVPRDDRTSAPAPLSAQPDLRGDYAGFASRFIAFVFDSAISIGIFMLVLSAASYAASVLTGSSIHWNRGDLWVVLAFFGWEFFYYAYFWTASGKTPGMTLLGVQVVGQDGSNVGTRRGLVRTLAFPLSFLLLVLGRAGGAASVPRARGQWSAVLKAVCGRMSSQAERDSCASLPEDTRGMVRNRRPPSLALLDRADLSGSASAGR